MISISSSAQTYLQGLLAKQEDADVAIRIFVAQPGTPQAETCIAYCRPGEEQEGDIAVEYDGFRAWFEGRSEAYLEDAEVDYQEDQMGGQLTSRRLMRGYQRLARTRRSRIASTMSCTTKLTQV